MAGSDVLALVSAHQVLAFGSSDRSGGRSAFRQAVVRVVLSSARISVVGRVLSLLADRVLRAAELRRRVVVTRPHVLSLVSADDVLAIAAPDLRRGTSVPDGAVVRIVGTRAGIPVGRRVASLLADRVLGAAELGGRVVLPRPSVVPGVLPDNVLSFASGDGGGRRSPPRQSVVRVVLPGARISVRRRVASLLADGELRTSDSRRRVVVAGTHVGSGVSAHQVLAFTASDVC